MARRNSVEQLPQAVREWLDKSLVEGNFSGYQLLEEALRDKGYAISKSAIHRYGQKIERRFAAIKASTEAARLLTEGASDDQDARSEAVIALVQTELFESIVNLQEAGDEDLDPAERIGLLSSAAKNIATLARASVNQKKFRLEEQARIEREARAKLLAEQEEKLQELRGSDGMSEQMESRIRRILLGKE
ncbi:putative membrane protein YqiK [Vogesella perlucida]|nr:putative membrane protein YqiK [Vogesella perlucida]